MTFIELLMTWGAGVIFGIAIAPWICMKEAERESDRTE